MSELTTTQNSDEVIRVLENSLYPGAKPESIALVLAYCRANGLDPFLKPVHIVPTNVKIGHNKYEWRDVLMPGIADYRIKAARSGEYGGKSEPEFGPERAYDLSGVKVRVPEWCKVTVSRIVQGQARTFTATERWMENYATAGKDTDAPNRMWLKRAYGQLAKCAEAQALRMAFPEFSGGQPTAEEMEGKETFTGPTLEHAPDISPRGKLNTEIPMAQPPSYPPPPEPTPNSNGKGRGMTARVWLDAFEQECQDATNEAEANAVLEKAMQMEDWLRQRPAAFARYESVKAAMLSRIYAVPPDLDEQGAAEPEPDEIDQQIARAGA